MPDPMKMTACTKVIVFVNQPLVHDVVVVGGGLIGLTVACEAQRRGLNVCVLDRSAPGREATWAAGGMLAPQLEAERDDVAFQLGVYSRRIYREWVRSIEDSAGFSVEFCEDGALVLAADDEALKTRWNRAAWQRERDHRVELLDRAALHTRVPGIHPEIAGAIHFPSEAQVDPRKLVRAVHVAAEVAGVDICAGVDARRFVLRDERVVGIETTSGLVAGGQFVVAAGAWSGLIDGTGSQGRISPVRGQMLALDARKPP